MSKREQTCLVKCENNVTNTYRGARNTLDIIPKSHLFDAYNMRYGVDNEDFGMGTEYANTSNVSANTDKDDAYSENSTSGVSTALPSSSSSEQDQYESMGLLAKRKNEVQQICKRFKVCFGWSSFMFILWVSLFCASLPIYDDFKRQCDTDNVFGVFGMCILCYQSLRYAGSVALFAFATYYTIVSIQDMSVKKIQHGYESVMRRLLHDDDDDDTQTDTKETHVRIRDNEEYTKDRAITDVLRKNKGVVPYRIIKMSGDIQRRTQFSREMDAMSDDVATNTTAATTSDTNGFTGKRSKQTLDSIKFILSTYSNSKNTVAAMFTYVEGGGTRKTDGKNNAAYDRTLCNLKAVLGVVDTIPFFSTICFLFIGLDKETYDGSITACSTSMVFNWTVAALIFTYSVFSFVPMSISLIRAFVNVANIRAKSKVDIPLSAYGTAQVDTDK